MTTIDWLALGFVTVIGLCLGSFINALEWRLHRQRQRSGIDRFVTDSTATRPLAIVGQCLTGVVEEIVDWLGWPLRTLRRGSLTSSRSKPDRYSIATGRSMCPHCRHELAARDLVPLASWLWLRGRCRYCRKRISCQYPLIEALTAAGFAASYLLWPQPVSGLAAVMLALWFCIVTGFVALGLYDAKWHNLPTEILHPVLWLAVLLLGVQVIGQGGHSVVAALNGVAVIWGLFFMFHCCGELLGRTLIGYGDVRLAVLLGLLAGGVLPAFAILFIASLSGTVMAAGLLATGRATRQSHIPYGLFLVAAGALVYLVTPHVSDWFLAWTGLA